MSQSYQIKNGVQVLDLDSCMPEKPVLVESRGKYLELRGDAKEVVLLLKEGPATVNMLEAALRKRMGAAALDAERIGRTLDRLKSFGLLQSDGDQPGSAEEPRKKNRETQLMLTLPLLQARHLEWLTRPLSRLLAPRVMMVTLPLLLLLQIYAWINILHPVVGSATALSATIHKLRPALFWLLALGNYAGLFLHELGHASACVRGGAKHGPIGLCLYWVLPGFYTEVNQAWRLPSQQRLIVDAGGIFFSLICAAFTLACYLLTGNSVFALLCAIYDVTVLINLIPFLRMDGYWMISDGLGIPNMMRANRELSQWVVLRLLGVPAQRPRILGISAWRKRLYFVYYTAFIFFTANFLWQIGAWYIPQLEHLSGAVGSALVASARAHIFTEAAKNAVKLFLVALPAFGLFLYFGRAVRRSVAWAMSVVAAQRS